MKEESWAVENEAQCRCESRLLLGGVRGRGIIEVVCLQLEGHKGDHRFCKRTQCGDECDWVSTVEVEVKWHRSSVPEKRVYKKTFGVTWQHAEELALAEKEPKKAKPRKSKKQS